MAFCGYCGSNVPDGMKFCTNCGKPIGVPAVSNNNNAENVSGMQNQDFGSRNGNYGTQNDTGVQGMNAGFNPNMNSGYNTNQSNYYNQVYSEPEKTGLWDRIKSVFSTMHKIAKIIAAVIAVIFLIGLVSMVATIAKGESSYSGSNSSRQTTTVSSSSGSTGSSSSFGSSSPSSGSASSGTSSSSSSSNSGAVDPDLKEFLDSYEDFMDDYVAFMKKYTNDPANAMSMMNEYLEMLQKYEDFASKADRYNTDTMSNADAAYYLEVMTRIEKKMLEMY